MAGTISRGIKAPIIREGDDIVKIVADSVLAAAEKDGFQLHERDVVAVTEAVVARADGNYCTVDDIAADVRDKLGDTVAVVFPIMSRNRFAICLRGIARGAKKVVVLLSYPADEEGNHLIDEDALFDAGVNPYTDTFTEAEFTARFGEPRHPFTGVNYLAYYRSLIEEEGAEAVILLGNDPAAVLPYTGNVLCSNVHERLRTARRLRKAGAEKVLTLWNSGRSARVKVLALQLLRLVIGAAFVSFIIGHTVHWSGMLGIFVVLAVVFAIAFSPRLKERGERMTKTFRENLSERERME
jgi:hypothetical protein